MTAPIAEVADGRAFLVAFTLPSTYSLLGPQPLDTAIHSRITAQRLACCAALGALDGR